ncbi:MAG: uncharacterized protein QOH93_378 [Chloroflexia bacterium]|jgi:predicted nucleic acid-binding protein|nr:uncharacterized protein [Chloroflexia bacterium]
MINDKLLLDTVFIQALLNRRDAYHQQALVLFPRVRNTREVWVTEAVLIEVANALSALNRSAAVEFIRQCYQTPNTRVVNIDTPLLHQALEL